MEIKQELIKGTIFEQFFTILASGKFAVIDHAPESGEETVGTMTDIERALYTLSQTNIDQAKVIKNRLDGKGEPFSSYDIPQLRQEYIACHLRAEAASKLLWNCIKERLREFEMPHNFGLGVRSDFCIVMMTQPPMKSVMDLLFGWK